MDEASFENDSAMLMYIFIYVHYVQLVTSEY